MTAPNEPTPPTEARPLDDVCENCGAPFTGPGAVAEYYASALCERCYRIIEDDDQLLTGRERPTMPNAPSVSDANAERATENAKDFVGMMAHVDTCLSGDISHAAQLFVRACDAVVTARLDALAPAASPPLAHGTTLDDGPGTPAGRLWWLLEELGRRLPPHNNYAAEPPELHYLRAIDALAPKATAMKFREVVMPPPPADFDTPPQPAVSTLTELELRNEYSAAKHAEPRPSYMHVAGLRAVANAAIARYVEEQQPRHGWHEFQNINPSGEP